MVRMFLSSLQGRTVRHGRSGPDAEYIWRLYP